MNKIAFNLFLVFCGFLVVVAGLGAKGTTVISSLSHIDRGYEKIEENFRNLGADIFRL